MLYKSCDYLNDRPRWSRAELAVCERILKENIPFPDVNQNPAHAYAECQIKFKEAFPFWGKKIGMRMIEQWQNRENFKNWRKITKVERDNLRTLIDLSLNEYEGKVEELLEEMSKKYNIACSSVCNLYCDDNAHFMRCVKEEKEEKMSTAAMLVRCAKLRVRSGKHDCEKHRLWPTLSATNRRKGSMYEMRCYKILDIDYYGMYEKEEEQTHESCTPDALFKEKKYVWKGFQCKFAEFKSYPLWPGISPSQKIKEVCSQIIKYANEYGSGIVIWKQGFAENIFEHADSGLTPQEVLFLKKRVRCVQTHDDKWCKRNSIPILH